MSGALPPVQPPPGSAQVTPGYRCPQCWRVSWHPTDLAERYCAACHQYESDGPPHAGLDLVAVMQKVKAAEQAATGRPPPVVAYRRGWWQVISVPPLGLTAFTNHLYLSVDPGWVMGKRIVVQRRPPDGSDTCGPELYSRRGVLSWARAEQLAHALMDHGPDVLMTRTSGHLPSPPDR